MQFLINYMYLELKVAVRLFKLFILCLSLTIIEEKHIRIYRYCLDNTYFVKRYLNLGV